MDEKMPAVQPGEVDFEGLERYFDEYPWTYQKVPARAGTGFRDLAMTVSRNRVELLAPHAGGSGLFLKIEQAPGDSAAVHLSVINGRTACDVLEGGEMTLEVDGAHIAAFHAEIAPTETATDLIVSEPARFISMLKESNRANIDLPIRGNGVKSFDFVTHSLRWPVSGSDA